MSIFTTRETVEKEVKEKLEVKYRLDKGKLNKEITTKDTIISKLESKIEVLQSDIKGVKEERDYYKGLEVDRVKLLQDKKQLVIEKEDLDEEIKLYVRRNERLDKKEQRLSELENDEYKKGYADGLADGLRKAHDITREDRKYMTMIAMSTNQSKAIETSMKALESGYGNSEDSKSTK